jgi:hypothetical protein
VRADGQAGVRLRPGAGGDAALSSEHSKVEGASDEEKEKDAFVSVVVSGGCAVIVVSGAVVSASGWISQV